jgi:hypothetical protein
MGFEWDTSGGRRGTMVRLANTIGILILAIVAWRAF